MHPGHWLYEKIRNPKVPIYSIAQSPIKSLENRLIGKSIVYSLERCSRNNFYDTFCGKNVTVMGYGGIGKSVAKNLKGRDAIVHVWDIDPIKRLQARIDGFITGEKKSLIGQSSIIVGVSGQQSLTKEDFKDLKFGALLCSGSSKRVEFDTNFLHKNAEVEKIDNKNSKVVLGNNTFYLLNDGQPINFNDGSVLDNILDLIFTELYMCLWSISMDRVSVGIKSLDYSIHSEICLVWEELYT
jgi:adenosylhomocysteinase